MKFNNYTEVFRSDKKAIIGSAVLVIFILMATLAPLIAPYDPNSMDYDFLSPPSLRHPLGTDDLGRDLLSRIIQGSQVSMFVGVTTVAIALAIGVSLGLLSGFYGGWIDFIIMRYIDLQWAFPNFLIAVYLVAVFGSGLSNVIIALSLAFVDDFARVVRGMVLSIKEQEYIAAARAVGCTDTRLMWVRILPNASAPIIVQVTVCMSYAILGEATLSFLGLGVEVDTPTWGLIISESRNFISRAWWVGVFPGLAIMLVVLSVNFVGDAIRDTSDVQET